MTVGPGIKPGLLTSSGEPDERSRAKRIARHYRRWGIAPRPENVADDNRRRRAVFITDLRNVHGRFPSVMRTFSYNESLELPINTLIIPSLGLRTEVRLLQGALS